MQILTRTYMVVIKDYDHMTSMKENVNWIKITHLLLFTSLNLKAPFCTSTFTQKKKIYENLSRYPHYKTIIPLPYVYYVR